MCVTICGRFLPDEGAVAGYGNRIRVKYTAKWGVQIAGMIFQTGSRACRSREHFFLHALTNSKKDVREIPSAPNLGQGFFSDISFALFAVVFQVIQDRLRLIQKYHQI